MLSTVALSYLGDMPPGTYQFHELNEIAREELIQRKWSNFHEVIRESEIANVLWSVRRSIEWLGYSFIDDHKHLGASIIRSVPAHIDKDVTKNEAFLLIVTDIEWECILYCENYELPLRKWGIYYLDPHKKHGVRASPEAAHASLVRIPVMIKNPPE